MDSEKRKCAQIALAAAAAAVLLALSAAGGLAGEVVLVAPVYLNGLPEYALMGSAGLANVACDALLEASGADVAVLSGGLFASSLPEGPVTYAELAGALTEDPELIMTQVTGSELRSMLNELLVYGSTDFPQLGGAAVIAERALDAEGEAGGIVTELKVRGEPAETEAVYTLATTRHLYADVCRLPHQAQPLGASLLDVISSYGSSAPAYALESAAGEQRVQIVSDSIDLSRAAAQLLLHIPSPVVCALSRPDTVPDTLMYAFMGQDRFLCADFPLASIPYTLCLSGTRIEAPASVDTDISVTKDAPAGRKTANTFSSKTVFVDLRGNDTIPDGTLLRVNLADIYPPGMLLFLYYYDDNGDIVAMPDGALVAENAAVTFPVAGGMTYVINDRELNQSALLTPTPQHPWSGAVAVVFALFGVWVAWTAVRLRRRRRSQ